ncbi:MAG TPA: hypothetical protein ENJ19_12040 [Gammaproteobacteria bacterium]|nr:hypothetical protein [Gammaproteobacteria bacterium]
MPVTLVFNKPHNALCPFTDADGRNALAGYIPVTGACATRHLGQQQPGERLETGIPLDNDKTR